MCWKDPDSTQNAKSDSTNHCTFFLAASHFTHSASRATVLQALNFRTDCCLKMTQQQNYDRSRDVMEMKGGVTAGRCDSFLLAAMILSAPVSGKVCLPAESFMTIAGAKAENIGVMVRENPLTTLSAAQQEKHNNESSNWTAKFWGGYIPIIITHVFKFRKRLITLLLFLKSNSTVMPLSFDQTIFDLMEKVETQTPII